MRLKMHGFYDKIIDHLYVEGEPFIDCYDDSAVQECDTYVSKSIALMIEPRSIMRSGYDFLLQNENWRRFKYIFTHDSELLKLPNAKLILCGSVWSWSDEPKTKFCSLVCSFKEMCELHLDRKRLAYRYERNGLVDVYGDYKGRDLVPWVDSSEYLRDYRYSIVVENYVDDYWFTEKICNCFANKVIPIYVGARKIDTFFNPQGIIDCHGRTVEAETEIHYLSKDKGKFFYEASIDAINDNYNRVREYDRFENWFFRNYGELLEDMK
mgnify:CR=1 FL=1